jgi:hypothetical protein
MPREGLFLSILKWRRPARRLTAFTPKLPLPSESYTQEHRVGQLRASLGVPQLTSRGRATTSSSPPCPTCSTYPTSGGCSTTRPRTSRTSCRQHPVRVRQRRLHGARVRQLVQRAGREEQHLLCIQLVLPDAGPGRARLRLRRACQDHRQKRVHTDHQLRRQGGTDALVGGALDLVCNVVCVEWEFVTLCTIRPVFYASE